MAVLDTPYSRLCNQITTDLEPPFVPAFDTGITYLRARGEIEDHGETAARLFSFRWGDNAELIANRGFTVSEFFESVLLVIQVKGSRHSVDNFDDAIRVEAISIVNRINVRSAWPAGVASVYAASATYSPKTDDSGELIITINFKSSNTI